MILVNTLPFDYQVQQLFLGNKNSALHIVVGDNGETLQDLRFLGHLEKEIVLPKKELLDSINEERERLGRGRVVEEIILTDAASLIGEKYVREGAIGYEDSDLTNVLGEKGIVSENAKIVTVMTDNTDLISSVLSVNQELRKTIRNQNFLRIGMSIHESGGNGYLAVIIFTE